MSDYPHTVAYCCKRQMQIDSFMELPKDKRPPESIWDNSDELDKWFDNVFHRDGGRTGIDVLLPDDIEG